MLTYLIYHSLASHKLKDKDLNEILKKSRINNAKKNITGCLIYFDEEFIQYLEGDSKDLLELYKKINKDKRHEHSVVLSKGKLSKRVFNGWDMSFKKYASNDISEMCEELGILSVENLKKANNQENAAFRLFSGVAEEIISNPIDL